MSCQYHAMSVPFTLIDNSELLYCLAILECLKLFFILMPNSGFLHKNSDVMTLVWHYHILLAASEEWMIDLDVPDNAVSFYQHFSLVKSMSPIAFHFQY